MVKFIRRKILFMWNFLKISKKEAIKAKKFKENWRNFTK